MSLVLLIAMCLLATACGDGSRNSLTDSDGNGSAGSAAEFRQPRSASKKFVEFGSEASSEVRAEASDVLAKNLEAREAADFELQCATLSKQQLEKIGRTKGAGAVKACARELGLLAKPLSKSESIRADQLIGPINALLLKGDQAYALFHGKDKNDYAIPMRKEGTEWKVAAIVTTKLGKG